VAPTCSTLSPPSLSFPFPHADKTAKSAADSSNGKLTGFDVDVMEAVAKKINMKLDWKLLEFSGLMVSPPSLSFPFPHADKTAKSAADSSKAHVFFFIKIPPYLKKQLQD
jgi:hypothetical protein